MAFNITLLKYTMIHMVAGLSSSSSVPGRKYSLKPPTRRIGNATNYTEIVRVFREFSELKPDNF